MAKDYTAVIDTNYYQNVAQVFSNLGNTISREMRLSQTAVTNAASAITQSLQSVGKTLESIENSFTSLINILTNLQNTFMMLVSSIQTGIANIQNTLQAFTSSIQTSFSSIQTSFEALVSSFQTGWSNIANSVQTFLTNLQPTLTALISTVQTNFTALVSGIQSSWTTLLTNLQPAITTLITTVQTKFSEFTSGVQTSWTSLTENTQGSITTFLETLGGSVSSITDAVNTFIASPTMQSFIESLKTGWQSIAENVKSFVNDLKDSVDKVTKIAEIVIIVVGTLLSIGIICTTLSASFLAISAALALLNVDFGTITSTLTDLLCPAFSFAKDTVTGFASFITDSFSSILSGAKGLISDIAGVFTSDTFSSVFSSVSSIVSSIKDTFSGGFSSIVSSAGDLASSLVSKLSGSGVTGTVGNLLSSAGSTVGNIASSLGSTAGSVLSTAGSAIGSVASTVGSVVSSAGSAVASAGSSVMGALGVTGSLATLGAGALVAGAAYLAYKGINQIVGWANRNKEAKRKDKERANALSRNYYTLAGIEAELKGSEWEFDREELFSLYDQMKTLKQNEGVKYVGQVVQGKDGKDYTITGVSGDVNKIYLNDPSGKNKTVKYGDWTKTFYDTGVDTSATDKYAKLYGQWYDQEQAAAAGYGYQALSDLVAQNPNAIQTQFGGSIDFTELETLGRNSEYYKANMPSFHTGGLISGEGFFLGLEGEGVLNRSAMRRIGTSGLSRLNGGDTTVGGTRNTFVIYAWDGEDVERTIEKKIIPVLREKSEAGVTVIHKNGIRNAS